MPLDDHQILDYQQPPAPWKRPTWVRWTIPLVSGGAAGCLMAFSGYGWFCGGILVGFTVGALSAAFSRKKRLAFGLLGNGVTVVTCIGVATINKWRSGGPMWD